MRTLTAAVLAAILAVLGLTACGTHHHHKPKPETKVVQLHGPGKSKIPLTPKAQAVIRQQHAAAAAGSDRTENDLHENQPPTRQQLQQARDVAPPGAPRIPQSTTFAAPSTAGCTSRFVRNYSNRAPGSRVVLGVIHWTGSSPIARSIADDLAIVRWFDTPAAQASSHYITDDDGHCFYVVPEAKKSWTEAAFNSVSVSDEHINIGKLPVFPTQKGRDAVIRLMRGWHKRWGIPYRRGAVTQSGCRVTRSGFLAHRDLGPCGGGHPDIGTPSAVDQLIKLAAAGDKPTTRRDRITCRKINYWRRHGRHHGQAERNAIDRRKALTRRHVACTSHGPVRR